MLDPLGDLAEDRGESRFGGSIPRFVGRSGEQNAARQNHRGGNGDQQRGDAHHDPEAGDGGDVASEQRGETGGRGRDGPKDRHDQFEQRLTERGGGVELAAVFSKPHGDVHRRRNADDRDERVKHRTDHAELNAGRDKQALRPDQRHFNDD